MCLAIPGKIVNKFEADGVQMGKIDFDGITKDICLAYVPDIKIGEYALVHVGFAIEKLDEKSALETLQMFRELGVLEEELGLSEPPAVAGGLNSNNSDANGEPFATADDSDLKEQNEIPARVS